MPDNQGNSVRKLLEQIAADVHAIREALVKPDVTGFIVRNTKPVKQGANEMAGKVLSLGAPGVQAMLDDQKNVMSISPVNAAGPTALDPKQPVPTYSVAPGTAVTIDPTIDPTGLSCAVKGVHGQSGTEVVTASYKNADGTVATATDTYTITVDPAELDVSGFDVSNSTPVAQ